MKKILENIKKKNIKNFIITFTYIFLIDVVFRLISKLDIFDWALLRIFLESVILSSLLNFIYQFISDKAIKIINLIVCFILSFYAFFQIGSNNYLGVYASINASSQLGKVTDYIVEFFSGYIFSYYLEFIPFILLVLYYIFIDKHTNHEKYKSIYTLIITTLVSIILFYLTITVKFIQNDYQVINNKELFHYPSNQSITVNQFGITGFGIIDIKSYILKTEPVVEYKVQKKKQEIVEKDYSRNIDDTKFNELINNETNTQKKNISNYLINRKISAKNDYTGIFKDKNVVVIMMESVNDIILEYPEYYPNIAKLYNEGISFVNNYSPRNSCATGNNEMTILTSLYTINNTCTYNNYRSNQYAESMFWMFRNNGYKATSYHNYTDTYYFRKKTHANMGSEFFYNIYDLGIKFTHIYEDVPSDLTLMEKATEKFINEDKFMSFITTITPHRPYHLSMPLGEKYVSMFTDVDASKSVKRYMSKIKETDLAIGYLIDKLTETGKLDDTVIVLAADHYPYSLLDSDVAKMLSYDISSDYEKDRTPFIIYNPSVTPKKVEKYTTIIDILPTLLNMFGIDYDPRYYFGEDVMGSKEDKVAIFTNGSWKNSKAYYNATTSKITYSNEEDTYTPEEIKEITQEVNARIDFSNQIIKKDYFTYLFSNISVVPSQNKIEEIQDETVVNEEVKIDN